MWNNEYKKFSKNQFHYDSNGNMIDNQTGKRYIQSATNGQDVVINGYYLKDDGRDINGNYTAAFHQPYGGDGYSPLTALGILLHSMDDPNPNLITGIAPTPGLANPNILNNPVGKVVFNNPFTKRQIQQMLKGPKDMRISYKYLTPEDISREAKYLASKEAEVTHPYTVRFLNENHKVADNLGKVSDRLRYLDTGQGFQPSAITNAQAMALLPQNDKAITVTAGYSGMGPANTVHKGTASMGNYDFYTYNFLGAMNYSAFQLEALAELEIDLNPDQIEYLNRQLDIIRRIHKKYGVKEFDKRSTSWTRFKPEQDHAGHRPYFKTDDYGMATGKISPLGEEYDPLDIIDLANANKAVGEFLGGGNTQIGGLGQVFHFGEPLRISAGKTRGFKDTESTFTAYPNKALKEELTSKWGKDLTFKGPLNKMEENISKISQKSPLVITGVYDPIWMDTQAAPANTLIRTSKNGGTIKYNR